MISEIENLKEHPTIVKAALYVKGNSHVFRTIGGIFFLISVIFGVIWLFGCDIEPLAYCMGLLTSAFLGLPSVAMFIVPDRKLVRDMTSHELLNFLQNSEVKCWQLLETQWAREAFLIEDPRFRLIGRYDNYGIHSEDFSEEWATKISHGKVYSHYYELVYDRALIERFVLVSIDGNRALIPLPLSQEKMILTRLQFMVGQILNRSYEDYEKYLSKIGMDFS